MKKVFTTIGLAVMLAAGSTFANAGIIIAGRAANPTDDSVITTDGTVTTTVQTSCDRTLDSTGIIIAGSAGIIIAGYTSLDVDTFLGDNPSGPVCVQNSDSSGLESTGIIIAG